MDDNNGLESDDSGHFPEQRILSFLSCFVVLGGTGYLAYTAVLTEVFQPSGFFHLINFILFLLLPLLVSALMLLSWIFAFFSGSKKESTDPFPLWGLGVLLLSVKFFIFPAIAAIILSVISIGKTQPLTDQTPQRNRAYVVLFFALLHLAAIPLLSVSNRQIPINLDTPKKNIPQLLKISKSLSPLNETELDKDIFSVYYYLGRNYMQAGNHGEAFTAFSKALKAGQFELANTYYHRGILYMNSRRYEDAIKDYDFAIHLSPKMYDAYQNRAVTFRLMGDYEDSVRACLKILKKFPDSAKTYSSLGWAYELLGKYDEAVEAQLMARKLNKFPQWTFPTARIVQCLKMQEDPGTRERLITKVEAADPKFAAQLRSVK